VPHAMVSSHPRHAAPAAPALPLPIDDWRGSPKADEITAATPAAIPEMRRINSFNSRDRPAATARSYARQGIGRDVSPWPIASAPSRQDGFTLPPTPAFSISRPAAESPPRMTGAGFSKSRWLRG
jgi:hypothetical protein